MFLIPALWREAKVDGSLEFHSSLVYIANSETEKATRETLSQKRKKKEKEKYPLLLSLFLSCDVGSQTQSSTQAAISAWKEVWWTQLLSQSWNDFFQTVLLVCTKRTLCETDVRLCFTHENNLCLCRWDVWIYLK